MFDLLYLLVERISLALLAFLIFLYSVARSDRTDSQGDATGSRHREDRAEKCQPGLRYSSDDELSKCGAREFQFRR